MSGIVKNSLRKSFFVAAKNLFVPSLSIDSTRTLNVRTLWHMSSQLNKVQNIQPLNNLSSKCSCGCGFSGAHTTDITCQSEASTSKMVHPKLTEGEKELAEFLTEEISAEMKLQEQKKVFSDLNGFKVKLDGSEVFMTKQDGDECVELSFNVNHSVSYRSDPEISADKPEELKSTPCFEVEVKRGDKTVGFTCSIVSSEEAQQNNDLFMIDELVVYDGEWKDSNYSVAGDTLDEALYDLLMNYLEDKGVTNELVGKVIDLSTAHEHSCYIDLLKQLQKFAQGK